MKTLKEKYLLYCKDLNTCYTKKEVRKHNAAMDKLGKLFHLLKEETDREFLLELLQDENERTRCLVAAHCLGLEIYLSEAQEVLNQLKENSKDPQMVFEAESVLLVWKQQGYLTF